MKYACRSLPHNTAPEDLELKLNDAEAHGWACISVVQRHADTLVVFRGEFSSVGDFEIATTLLDSVV